MYYIPVFPCSDIIALKGCAYSNWSMHKSSLRREEPKKWMSVCASCLNKFGSAACTFDVVKRLNNVDLPTLGRPTIAITEDIDLKQKLGLLF